MFMERALFCLEYESLEQVKMSRYLCIVKTGIRDLLANNGYKTLVEMHDHAKRIEIESETQTREKRQTSTLSQLVAKNFKSIGSRFGGQKGHTCNVCEKFHDGP